jgi:hypothetical protein
MLKMNKAHIAAAMLAGGLLGWTCGPAAAQGRIEGQVQAGGGPSYVSPSTASTGEEQEREGTANDDTSLRTV